jgi:hypothetical protein
MPQLAQQSDRLDPAEDFLDPLPLFLAYFITGVPSRAPVYPAPASTLVLRHMGCDFHLSQLVDELALVVSFTCSLRDYITLF